MAPHLFNRLQRTRREKKDSSRSSSAHSRASDVPEERASSESRPRQGTYNVHPLSAIPIRQRGELGKTGESHPCDASASQVVPNVLSSDAAVLTTNLQARQQTDPQMPETNHPKPSHAPKTSTSAQCQAPIWSRAITSFKQTHPDDYKSLGEAIGTFPNSEDLSGLRTTPALEKPKQWRNAWIMRLQNYLPSLRTIKALAMELSNLDPHKVAPHICAAIFFAIEV